MSELRTSLPDIKLRALEPEDLDWLYELENDRSLWDVGSAPMHYSRFALRQYIAAQPQDFFRDGELRLVVEADGQENPVGLVDLTNYSALDRRAEVGIVDMVALRSNPLKCMPVVIYICVCYMPWCLHSIMSVVEKPFFQSDTR